MVRCVSIHVLTVFPRTIGFLCPCKCECRCLAVQDIVVIIVLRKEVETGFFDSVLSEPVVPSWVETTSFPSLASAQHENESSCCW